MRLAVGVAKHDDPAVEKIETAHEIPAGGARQTDRIPGLGETLPSSPSNGTGNDKARPGAGLPEFKGIAGFVAMVALRHRSIRVYLSPISGAVVIVLKGEITRRVNLWLP